MRRLLLGIGAFTLALVLGGAARADSPEAAHYRPAVRHEVVRHEVVRREVVRHEVERRVEVRHVERPVVRHFEGHRR
jgi:hypothetical protein